MLIDHPVVLGEYLRTIVLWPDGSEVGEHVIDVIADTGSVLELRRFFGVGSRRRILTPSRCGT